MRPVADSRGTSDRDGGGRFGRSSARTAGRYSSSMRAVIALVLGAAALALPVAAEAKYPQAWGATQQYLAGATASCAAQHPEAGGWCTQLETFSVTMNVLATGRYRIQVANMVPRSNFRYFAWILPDGMTLTRVLGTRGGDCGTSSGMISCIRNLAAHGHRQGNLVVDFTASGRAPTHAKGYWIHYGFVTPFLDQPQAFNDLPICDLGEKSTKQHPCLK